MLVCHRFGQQYVGGHSLAFLQPDGRLGAAVSVVGNAEVGFHLHDGWGCEFGCVFSVLVSLTAGVDGATVLFDLNLDVLDGLFCGQIGHQNLKIAVGILVARGKKGHR